MEPHGWGAPEFKPDSFVYAPHRGPVLVDASMPNRLGRRMVAYVLDVLNGRRPLPRTFRGDEAGAWKDLAFYIRREATAGAIPKDIANQLIQRVMRKTPGAAEWLIE